MRLYSRRVSILGAAMLTLLLAMTAGPVAAQEDGEPYQLVISASACDEFPVTDETQCEPKADATFTVTTQDGDALGSCTTELPSPDSTSGRCEVEVSYGMSVIVTEDTSTVPEGYVPVENPQTYETPAEVALGGPGADVTFVNVLQADSGDEDVAGDGDDSTDNGTTDDDFGAVEELPDTGVGVTVQQDGLGSLAALLAVSASMLLSGGFFVQRYAFTRR